MHRRPTHLSLLGRERCAQAKSAFALLHQWAFGHSGMRARGKIRTPLLPSWQRSRTRLPSSRRALHLGSGRRRCGLTAQLRGRYFSSLLAIISRVRRACHACGGDRERLSTYHAARAVLFSIRAFADHSRSRRRRRSRGSRAGIAPACAAPNVTNGFQPE